jgi:hypothetical protein
MRYSIYSSVAALKHVVTCLRAKGPREKLQKDHALSGIEILEKYDRLITFCEKDTGGYLALQEAVKVYLANNKEREK